MAKKFYTLIIKNKWMSLGIILLLTAFFAFEIRNMVVRTEITDLYPLDHPYTKIHMKYKDKLGSPFKVFLMLKVKEGDVYNKETLEKTLRITEALDAIPAVNHNHVYSIGSNKIKKVKITEAGVESFPLMFKGVPEFMEEFKQTIRTAPGVFGVWVSQNEKCLLFSAGFIERLIDYDVIFEKINKIVEQETDINTDIYAVGEPLLMGWINYYQDEILYIFILTFFSFLILLYAYFRNFLGVMVVIPPIGLGIVWFLGFSGLLGYNIDPLTIVIPLLIVARSLSHAVQFTERYFETYYELGEKDVDEACIKTMCHIVRPGLLGIVTDALGIILIAVAPVPIMQKLAYLCGFWAMSNIVTGLFFTPVFISLCGRWQPKNISHIVDMEKGVTQKILGVIAKAGYGKAGVVTFIVTIAVVAFTGYHGSKVEIGDIHPGSSLLWEDSFYNQSTKQINNNFPGTEELYVIFEGEGERPIENPPFLRVLNAFQRYMEESPDVGRTLSLADILPPIYRRIYDGNPKWLSFPQTRVEGYQLLFQLQSKSAPGDYDLYFARDESIANVIVWYKNHMGETLRNAIQRVKAFIEDNKEMLADSKCTVQLASGNLGTMAAVNEVVHKSQVLNFSLVMAVVLVLCAIAYRSVVAAIVLMIPLNVTNIITLAIMRWFEIGLNINTLPVVSVGVGVGIDYGIYLLSRICEEYQIEGEYSLEVATRAIKTTGKAIFFTATTMIVGVMFFYFFSSVKFQAEMGLMLAIIMFINIFAALVLIPVLVQIFRPKFLGRVNFHKDSFQAVASPAQA